MLYTRSFTLIIDSGRPEARISRWRSRPLVGVGIACSYGPDTLDTAVAIVPVPCWIARLFRVVLSSLVLTVWFPGQYAGAREA